MTLAAGSHPVPPGHLAAVVTHFEITAPQIPADPFPDGVTADREAISVEAYRSLFRAIGEPWLWVSRLRMNDADLSAILVDPKVETYIVRRADRAVGLVELDFRTDGACELAFFGLIQSETGGGLGKSMMGLAQHRAFSYPIERLHLHTCTLDSPQAVGFYMSCGFQPIRQDVEILEDPRCQGIFPPDASPRNPMMRP